MFEKRIVIDARGHLVGRLASVIAKELLSGQKIVVVRAEELNISGSFARNRERYQRFLHKMTRTNPKWGPYHERAPAKMFHRAVRGMIPHKTKRGAEAMARLRVFEGVPVPFDTTKRTVVPEALRYMRLRPKRKYTVLGELASSVGWKYSDVIAKLEDKRKVRSAAFHKRKKAILALRAQAVEKTSKDLSSVNEVLATYAH